MVLLVISMNDEMLRLSLIDLMNNNLLNEFVNDVFDYDLKNNEYIYMQYKIVDNNIVINIYDNNCDNRFKAYIFTNSDFEKDDDNFYYININECYNEYKRKKKLNNLFLIGVLLKEKSNEEKKKIIDYIENNDIKNILLKHFTV